MTNNDLFREADRLKADMQALGVAQKDFLLTAADQEGYVLTEDFIRQLHLLLCKEEDPAHAGTYRSADVELPAQEAMGPDSNELPRFMEHFMNQMKTSKNLFHPIEYAAICCKRLMELQPFFTGNQKVAQMAMYQILRNDGYAVVIPPELEQQYESALNAALRKQNPDIDSFVKLIAECVISNERKLVDGLL